MGISVSSTFSVINDSMGLYLDPANSRSYSGTGATWYDLSGNGNHCKFNNGVAPKHDGKNFRFAGEFGVITTDGTGSLDFRNSQTICLWMYQSAQGVRRNPWNQAYGGYGTWTHERGTSINYYYGNAGRNASPYTAIGSSDIPESEWTFCVSTRDVEYVRWYINGELVYERDNSFGVLALTTSNINIGDGYVSPWLGSMGPVLAYKDALTASEVKSLYEFFLPRYQ